MRALLRRLKAGTEPLNYGRAIVAGWARQVLSPLAGRGALDVLDLGCGRGDDLVNIRAALGEAPVRLHGIESWAPNQEAARALGIAIEDVDLERATYPYPDGSMDLIVANQIVEHTKEIFWIFSECSRILRPDGVLIVGVPNLASLHNRILLLAGEQPSTIEPLSAHIRGFTVPGFRRLIEADAIFRVEAVSGSNFYPFPPFLSRLLSRLFPRLSVSIFFLVRKVHPTRQFKEVLASRFFETSYFVGDSPRQAQR
jgi:SAM-dependent methyltransferase